MHRTARSFARVLSGPLVALMLVMSAVAPVYERADFGHELAIESEHDPATCPPPHDHSVCVMSSAHHGVAAPGQSTPELATVARALGPMPTAPTPTRRAGLLPSPRGPPAA